MKKIMFKPEFEQKLLKLRIKRKFVRNLTRTTPIYINLLNAKENWYDFVCAAFHWKDTPEGYDYWSNIALK